MSRFIERRGRRVVILMAIVAALALVIAVG